MDYAEYLQCEFEYKYVQKQFLSEEKKNVYYKRAKQM